MIKNYNNVFEGIDLSRLPAQYRKILCLYDLEDVYRRNESTIFEAIHQWSTWHKQKRTAMIIDRKLVQAAQVRAILIAHGSQGVMEEACADPPAHDLVRCLGYDLPSHGAYVEHNNMVQTVGLTTVSIEHLLETLYQYDSRNPIIGGTNFFQGQTRVGIGRMKKDEEHIYVFIAAHPEEWKE